VSLSVNLSSPRFSSLSKTGFPNDLKVVVGGARIDRKEKALGNG